MSDFDIIKGVPIEQSLFGKAASKRWPWRHMELGDLTLIPQDQVSKAINAIEQYRRNHPDKRWRRWKVDAGATAFQRIA